MKCHHLAFSRDTVDWQIWIDAGPAGLPRKFLMKYKLLDGAPQFSAIFDDWELDVEIPDAHFVPVLAQDATQIDFIASIQQGGRHHRHAVAHELARSRRSGPAAYPTATGNVPRFGWRNLRSATSPVVPRCRRSINNWPASVR